MKKFTNLKIFMNITAIMLIFLFSGAGSLLNASVQTCIEAWSTVPITSIIMLNTLPAIVSMPVMLIVGGIVGKKISYKMTAIIGTILIIIGGLGPFFYAPSWTIVLIFRAIIGAGAGFYGVRTALLIKSVPIEKQTKYIGISSFFFSGGNIIISPVVGMLAGISWRHPFLINAFAIFILLMILLFLIEPKKDIEIPPHDEANSKLAKETKISKRIFIYIILQFIATCSIYPMLAGMSTFVVLKGLGTATLAGTILAVNTIGGSAISLLLAQVQRIFKQYTLTLGYALIGLGELLALKVISTVAIFAGSVMVGMGFLICFSMLQVYNGMVSHPSRVAFTSTLILSANQIGMFISGFFIIGSHEILKQGSVIESSWLGGIIVFAAIVLFTIIFNKVVVPETSNVND